MGLVDSTNPKTMADNIRKLEKMVKEAGSELPTPGAGDVGKIIKVGLSGYVLADEYSYTPPAYSTTEVNTGKKWVDGKDIYAITFVGKTPTTGNTQLALSNVDTLISYRGVHSSTQGRWSDFNYDFRSSYYGESAGIFYLIASTSETYQDVDYSVTFYYTKATPTPEPTNETKKKTTRKDKSE